MPFERHARSRLVTSRRKRADLAAVERRLAALDFDGVEINTRCLLRARPARPAAYRRMLADLAAVRAAGSDRAAALALRGKILCILEGHRGAARALRSALALEPESPRAWVWLGEVLLLQARVADARKAFETALRLDPGCAWAHFFNAVVRSIDEPDAAGQEAALLLKSAKKGDARRAALILRCLTEAVGQRIPSARRSLARLSRTKVSRRLLGQVARNVRALELAVRKPAEPDDPAFQRASALEPAILLLRAGKVRAALSFMKAEASKLEREDGSFDTLQRRLRLELLALEFDRARSTAERILRRTREYRQLQQLQRPFFGKEFDFLQLPKPYIARAMEALNLFVDRFPSSPWGYYWRDVFKDIFGLNDGHLGDLERLRRAPERFDWMRCHIGYRDLFREDFPRALAELRTAAAASKPGDWAARCLSGEALACLGDLRGAMKAFSAAARAAPPEQAGSVLAWKGAVLLWSGEYAPALEATRAAAASGAGFAHCWLGGCLVKLGRFEEALSPLRRAIELTPYDAEARGWLAEAYLRLGRLEDASREIELAMNGFQRYCSFHLRAVDGLVRSARGDREALRKALVDIPRRFVEEIKRRTDLDLDTDDGARAALESLLDLSRGVRRGSYENRIWMRA
jgi:tetratricopeptide (TPR) repeat protein